MAGAFSAPAYYGAGDGPQSVAVGDFNADGKPDLALTNQFTLAPNRNGVSILLNNGAGGFSGPTFYNLGSRLPEGVAVGDFNGDNKLDLASANGGALDSVAVLLGNGDGTFSAPVYIPVSGNLYSVAVGEFNGDSKLDLAAAGDGGVAVLLGNGDGTFSAPTIFGAGSAPRSVGIDDLNVDGKPDLTVANFLSDDVSVLLGVGGGSFTGPYSFNAGSRPNSIAVGDFNVDGRPDLATANANSNDVTVLLTAAPRCRSRSHPPRCPVAPPAHPTARPSPPAAAPRLTALPSPRARCRRA